jgi:membrane associated rhomboid family serine protease
MTSTPVGMRCPECARQKTKVRTAATLTGDPRLTYALIAINVIAWVAMVASGAPLTDVGGSIYQDGALFGPYVARGDWWRVVTGGFLHAGIIHIALNMYFLYFLGTMLEPMIGRLRFGLIYAVSLLGGAFAVMAFSPNTPTVGASAAVFGLMGAAIIAMRERGIDPWQSGLGIILVLNLGITFLNPSISKAGHVGGLVAGLIAGYLLFMVGERRRSATTPVLAACIVLCVALAVGAVVAANLAPAPTFN